MTILKKCPWTAPPVILAALCVAMTTNVPSALAQSPQPPEQRLTSINDARRQSTDYVNGLAAAVQAERRDDVWAAQKQSALRGSVAAERSLPRGALKSVECRSSKCSLQLNLSAERSPRAAVEQQAAITRWIAASQPCAYTMTNPAAVSQSMLIFLDCKR
jgi:hypothetical protein